MTASITCLLIVTPSLPIEHFISVSKFTGHCQLVNALSLLGVTYPSPSFFFVAKISRTFDAKTCFGGFSSSASFRWATAHLANSSPSYKIDHKEFITMAFNLNLHCHSKYSDNYASFYLTLMLPLYLYLQSHRFQYKYCRGTSINISSWNYYLSGVKNICVCTFNITTN